MNLQLSLEFGCSCMVAWMAWIGWPVASVALLYLRFGEPHRRRSIRSVRVCSTYVSMRTECTESICEKVSPNETSASDDIQTDTLELIS